MEVQNKRIPDDEFRKLREEVLGQWPTGKDVNLQEAFDYHKKMPEGKDFSRKLKTAKEKGQTLIQPRAGVALIKEHIELLTYLQAMKRRKTAFWNPSSRSGPCSTASRPSITAFRAAVRSLKAWIFRCRCVTALPTPAC